MTIRQRDPEEIPKSCFVSLPNFHTFKSQKESERKTFFARKAHAGQEKSRR